MPVSDPPLLVHARLAVAADGGPACLVKEAAGPDGAAAVRWEAAVLAAARHPGVVELDHADDHRPALWIRLAGTHTLDTLPPCPPPVAAGLVAAVAETVADLHAVGIVHGRIEPDHVVIGPGGRPLLCSFGGATVAGEPAPGHEVRHPADDVAAVGELLHRLCRGDDPGDPIPERRRTGRRHGRPWQRRALQNLADQAGADDPRARPSARRLAAALVQTFPDATLPSLDPEPARADDPASASSPAVGSSTVAAPVPPSDRADVGVARPGQADTGAFGAAAAARPRSTARAARPRRGGWAALAVVGVTLIALGVASLRTGARPTLASATTTPAAADAPDAGTGAPDAGTGPGPATAPVTGRAATGTADRSVGASTDAATTDTASTDAAASGAPTPPPGAVAGTATGPCPARSCAAVGRDGTITWAGRRYGVGTVGDQLVVADPDCDGTPTVHLLRPATGELFTFAGLPRDGGGLLPGERTVLPVGSELVGGADREDGCSDGTLRRPDGTVEALDDVVGAP